MRSEGIEYARRLSGRLASSAQGSLQGSNEQKSVCALMREPVMCAVGLNHLSAYVDDASVNDPKPTSSPERKVKNASADKRSAVGDANGH